jgi:tripartite-type tricarboxylate transporter receptor subunit TctC
MSSMPRRWPGGHRDFHGAKVQPARQSTVVKRFALSDLSGGAMTRFLKACLIAASVAIGISATAAANEISEFYSKNNLTMIVPFSAGGGIDIYARLLSRHLGRHVPGEPAVVVQNRPGAGGISGLNYLTNVAPKDGTVIATMTPPNAVAPLMGSSAAKFDPLGFEWIGNIARDSPSCTVSQHSKIKRFEDLFSREASFGATGYDATTAQHALVLRNVLGAKVKVVVGYPGTRDIWLAMERDEVDGACVIWSSLATGPLAQQFEEGKMRPIVQFGSTKVPVFGDAPLIYELAKNDEDRAIFRFIFGQTEATRPFTAAHGVPAARLAALREAFMATMNDPAFLQEAKQLALIVDPMNAEETSSVFRAILSTPKQIIERAMAAMKR